MLNLLACGPGSGMSQASFGTQLFFLGVLLVAAVITMTPFVVAGLIVRAIARFISSAATRSAR